jgi:ketosteroid isomerase-like protein
MDEIVAAFNEHDADRVAGYFAKDGAMVLAAGPDIWGKRITGPNDIRAALAARFTAVPDIRWIDGKTWIVGNKVLSEWRVQGTPKEGKPLDCVGCDLWEFEGGKIKKKDTYYKLVTT